MREADIRLFKTITSHLRGHGGRSLDPATEQAISALHSALNAKWRDSVLDLLTVGSLQPSARHRAAIAEAVQDRFIGDDEVGIRKQILQYADLFGEHPSMWMEEDEKELRSEIDTAVSHIVGYAKETS